jgi:hypothetical protein
MAGVSVLQTMGSVWPTVNEYDAIEICRKLAENYDEGHIVSRRRP